MPLKGAARGSRPQPALRPGALQPREPDDRPGRARATPSRRYEQLLAVDPQCARGPRALCRSQRAWRTPPIRSSADCARRSRGPARRPRTRRASVSRSARRSTDAPRTTRRSRRTPPPIGTAARAPEPTQCSTTGDGRRRSIDELIATFTPERGPYTAPGPPARPIFICGMFRSGSTLTEQVLAGALEGERRRRARFHSVARAQDTGSVPCAHGAARRRQQLDELAARYLAELATVVSRCSARHRQAA